MARTRNSSHNKSAQQSSDVDQVSRTAPKITSKAKRTLDTVSGTTAIELEQPRQSKKPRTTVKETAAVPTPGLPSPQAARRSTRTTANTKALAGGQKRKRRTKAEIAADNAAAETERQRLEEVANEKKRKIVQMDLQEDINRMETEARVIRKFSDLDHGLELSEEEFDGYNDVLGSSSSEDAPEDDFLALKRKNIALQKKLSELEAQASGGGKKNIGGKKTKHVAFTAASGLRSDWNSRPGAAKVAPKKRSHVEILSGGLQDSDIDDTNTFAKDATSSRKPISLTDEQLEKASKSATRDTSRKNELVVAISNKSDSEEDFFPPPKTSLPPKSSVKVTKKKTQAKVKSEPKELHAAASEKVALVTTHHFNTNNVRTDHLPDFVKLLWRKAFLPTLYDNFFASDEPFAQFFKGSDAFITLLQDIVDEFFPATTYKVNAADAIHQLAYKRVNERRSNIGLAAMEIVKQHVSTLGGDKEAREWIRWAMRISDGPLFFKKPSPSNSPNDRQDPNYKHPEGRLLSRFIIDLATPCLRLKKGSISVNGYPRGLFALIMAALERAVRSLLKPSEDVREFSNEFWGSKVSIYHSSLLAIGDDRWKEIFDECGLGVAKENADDSDKNNQADLSLLDHNRAFLFDFASPAKHRS
ncbi:hypothetical protein BJ912DRAFT_1070237 [Pholiota molesta]|nr:hypothetical protein BJ912DRAFT_1070237 [Pholiota molesta]